jgi:hypothetical protein
MSAHGPGQHRGFQVTALPDEVAVANCRAIGSKAVRMGVDIEVIRFELDTLEEDRRFSACGCV